MATDPIDEAFVEIKPDLSHFDRDVQRELNDSFRDIENKVDDLTDAINHQFDRLINALDEHFGALEHSAKDTFEEIRDQARSAGRHIATDIEVGTKIAKHQIDDLADDAHHDFNRIERDARGSGFSIGRMFSNIGQGIVNIFTTVSEMASNIGSKVGSLGSTIGQVGSTIGSVTGSIGSVAQIAAYAVLIPVVIGLVGALIQLSAALFAIPAALGVAGAAIAPLIIAFKGFGEAIGAGLSGDTEKFNEALKGLAPNAAKVVKEFVALNPILKQIKNTVQNNFFAPLVNVVGPAIKTILATIGPGLAMVATSLGKLAASFLEMLSSNDVLEDIGNVFESTVRIIDNFGPHIIDLFGVLFGIMEKGLPFVERLFDAFGDGIDSVTKWLSDIQSNGQLTAWLERAWSIGKDLWEVIKLVGENVLLLFGAFGDEGQDTLKGVADQLRTINDYLKSTEGQETLHNLGVLIHWAGNALVFVISATVGAYRQLNALFALIRAIGPFFGRLGDWFSNTWTSIVEWTKSAWHTVQDTVIGGWNAVVAYFASVWSYFTGLFVNGWNSAIQTVADFILRVKNAIVAFPGVLKQFLSDAVHTVAFDIGFIIGTIVKFFIDMPGRIGAALAFLWQGLVNTWTNIVNFFTETIPALAVNVGTWFADMWRRAWNATVSLVTSILHFISELPGKFWNYVLELQNRVVGTFNSLKNTVVQRVKDLVSGAKDEAGKLPGQVENAAKGVISRMYNLGRDMIIGLGNGMKDLAGWVADKAREIVLDAWNGAKRAIGSNSPSKKWMQTGEDSAEGYAIGFDSYDLTKQIVSSIKMPFDKFNRSTQQTPSYNPQVNVGGAQIVAYLQIGDDQLQPVMVRTMYENPQDVALAAQQGDTALSRRR